MYILSFIDQEESYSSWLDGKHDNTIDRKTKDNLYVVRFDYHAKYLITINDMVLNLSIGSKSCFVASDGSAIVQLLFK